VWGKDAFSAFDEGQKIGIPDDVLFPDQDRFQFPASDVVFKSLRATLQFLGGTTQAPQLERFTRHSLPLVSG
jgi:hypothetical protein